MAIKSKIQQFNPISGIYPEIRANKIKIKTIACYGEDIDSPHPCVYLHTNKYGKVKCPYCSKLFVIDSAIKDNI